MNGFLDSIPVDAVSRFESTLLSIMRSEHAAVLGTIRDTRTLDDETAAELKEIIGGFVKTFA